jgi:hypothetical protein
MSENENNNSWLESLMLSLMLLSFIALSFPFMLTDLNSMGFENFINYKFILLALSLIGAVSFAIHLRQIANKKYYGFFGSFFLFFLVLDFGLAMGYFLSESDLIIELGSKNISDKNINILWEMTPYSVGAFLLIDKYLSTTFKTKKEFEKENKEKQKFFMKNTVDLINEMENELKEIKSNFNYYKENNKNNTFKNYKGSLFSLYSSIFIKLNWIFSHNEVKEILNDNKILKIRIEDLIYKLFTDNSYNELVLSANGNNNQKGGLFDSSQISKEHVLKNEIILEYLKEVEGIELRSFNLFDLDKANDYIVNLFNKEEFINLVQNKNLKKKFKEIRKLIDFCKKK